MYYCTNCHRVTPERAESCPYCDKFDRLRPAEEADECRLTELDALNASVLEEILLWLTRLKGDDTYVENP